MRKTITHIRLSKLVNAVAVGVGTIQLWWVVVGRVMATWYVRRTVLWNDKRNGGVLTSAGLWQIVNVLIVLVISTGISTPTATVFIRVRGVALVTANA